MDETEYLKRLLEELTHSGSKSLHSQKLKNVIDLCKKDDVFLEVAYQDLFDYLREEHSEIKLSSIQLINELFLIFPPFQKLVVDNLKKFLDDGSCVERFEGMPPPAWAAQDARKLCFRVVFAWFQKFGGQYRILRSAINRLESSHNVDFTLFEIVDPKEKAERVEREKRMNLINREMLKKVDQEMEDMKDEISSTLTSLQSCFSLLLPSPDEFSEQVDEADFEDLRLFGVLNQRGIVVDLNIEEKIKVEECEENSAILEAAKDSFVLIKNRFLPKTIAWIELLKKTQSDISKIKVAERQSEVLQGAVAKYNKLEIISSKAVDTSSDDEFEEVVPKCDQKTAEKEEKNFFSGLLEGEKVEKAVVKRASIPDIPSTSKDVTRKSELLKIAPKLPFDVDLYHWEDANLQAPKVIPVNIDNSSIWSSPISDMAEMAVPGGSEVLRSRVIEFSGKFEPVQKACRAPLPSGKLCPRHDRIKCPFHGLIVDRDNEGNVVNQSDKEKIKRPKTEQVPDWQDPVLLAELKEKTGLDLTIPKKGQRTKKPKYPGLTNIKTVEETSKTRIAKKIFNKQSVKRVAASLDKLDHKRHRDKFGDQFNYIHDTS